MLNRCVAHTEIHAFKFTQILEFMFRRFLFVGIWFETHSPNNESTHKMLKMLSTVCVCSCLKITLYLIWDHLSPEIRFAFARHPYTHPHTQTNLPLSPCRRVKIILSIFAYLFSTLPDSPLHIFIGVFFLHPDQNIKLPASHKPNTYSANSARNT